jgi:integrase
VGRRPLVRVAEAPGLTVGELILRFWPHVEQHYRRRDGSPTAEAENYRYALRPLRQLYETLAAAEFSPLKLKAVRQGMAEAGMARTLVNGRVARIVRMYRRAVSEELVPETVCRALETVGGLQEGRCEARESEPVGPVEDAVVEANLPHLPPAVAAMIRLQRLTGARSGEVCGMRACDLEVAGPVWFYRPAQHKTVHRGKARVIALGPQAQAVVKPFLTTDLAAPLFSPAREAEAKAALLRARRKSKVQPSQRNRRKAQRKRPPGFWYTPHAIGVAVRWACDRADRAARQARENELAAVEGRVPVVVPKKVSSAERLVPRWHSHQLRHGHATEVRKRFGLEAARTALVFVVNRWLTLLAKTWVTLGSPRGLR